MCFVDAMKMALLYNVKYSEVSTIINHKIDNLLAGILRQIRLRENRLNKMRRRGSFAVDDSKCFDNDGAQYIGCIHGNIIKRSLTKVFSSYRLFRSCDNLLVL